jgi:hypothetical protein
VYIDGPVILQGHPQNPYQLRKTPEKSPTGTSKGVCAEETEPEMQFALQFAKHCATARASMAPMPRKTPEKAPF